jgi:hypothetical protein
MDISGVSIPVQPAAYPEGPRDAQLQSAVREALESQSHGNEGDNSEVRNDQAQAPARLEARSGLGQLVDEMA